MINYLYYKRGEEWVRVEADFHSREYESESAAFEGGQCEEQYRITLTYTEVRKFDGRRRVKRVTFAGSMLGPISAIYIVPGENDKIFVDYNGNGGVSRFQASSAVNIEDLRDFNVRLSNGEEDTCGNLGGEETCSTVFKKNGVTVLTLPDCPEVTTRNSCKECCEKLISVARRIQV